jgi:predicted protein tyrosine phosphatase
VHLKRVLFVCSQNRFRSPTAEQIFASWPGIEVDSAGLAADAVTPLDAEMVEWADLIFVMTRTHRNRLSKLFRAHLKHAKVICLNVPDEFEYMDPELVRILQNKVSRHLPQG